MKMSPEVVTISLTEEESALLLDWAVEILGRKRTKPGSVDHSLHQKVWDAWSDAAKGREIE